MLEEVVKIGFQKYFEKQITFSDKEKESLGSVSLRLGNLNENGKKEVNNQIEQYKKLYDDTLVSAGGTPFYNREPFAADKVGEVDLQSKEYLEAKFAEEEEI